MPYSLDCPAMQAMSEGQAMWKSANKPDLERYHKEQGPDPSMGVYWLAQGPGETLPQPDSSTT